MGWKKQSQETLISHIKMKTFFYNFNNIAIVKVILYSKNLNSVTDKQKKKKNR